MKKKFYALIFAFLFFFNYSQFIVTSEILKENTNIFLSNHYDIETSLNDIAKRELTDYDGFFSIPKSYIINGVPYVAQDEGDEIMGAHYCFYASLEMIFRYFGFNITKYQILYESGGGYSLGYKPKLNRIIFKPHIMPPYKFNLRTSVAISEGTDDMEFQAKLHGCSCRHIYPKLSNTFILNWINYWNTLKFYISSDIPVIASVDPVAWPIYMEINNKSEIPLLIRGGHAVVIVGYNEENNTICCQDPYAGACHSPEKGTYRWISLNDFRKAVRRSYWDLIDSNSCEMIVIKKLDICPLPKEIAIDIAHERNIDRMSGDESSYDSDYIAKDFHKFGINALKELKKDFKQKFTLRLPIYWILCKNIFFKNYFFGDVVKLFAYVSIVKYDMSQYLLQNAELRPYCSREGELLNIESSYWKNLSYCAHDLIENLTCDSFFDTNNNCKIILDDIINIIDNIIFIEEAVITSEYD